MDIFLEAKNYLISKFGNEELSKVWPYSRVMHQLAIDVYKTVINNKKALEKLDYKEWVKTVKDKTFTAKDLGL